MDPSFSLAASDTLTMKNKWILVLISFILAAGCQQSPSSPPPSSGESQHPEDEHDHDHGALGPHGGHVLVLGDEQYHAEWTHDDKSGEIAIYLLDADIKEDVATAAELITIATTIREETQTYELAADNQDQADPPRASRFKTTNPNLLTALKQAGSGVDAQVRVVIDGSLFRGTFEKHDHDH